MGIRHLQSFGRAELANSVAEALRKLKQPCDKNCGNCEHFQDENNDGYPTNWCYENNTSTTADDYCDEHKKI